MSISLKHICRVLTPDEPEQADERLLDRFLDRDDCTALEALVRRHASMIWGVCRRVLGNHHDAEDAFQATLLVFVRRASAIRPRASVGNWLYGVAHRTALKALATRTKRRLRETAPAELPEPNINLGNDNDLLSALDGELCRLPDKHRTVIVLCELEGRSVREAAVQLGCPEGTVASRLARARCMLASRLRRRGLTVAGTLGGVLSVTGVTASIPNSVLNPAIEALPATGHGAGYRISPQVLDLSEGVLKAMATTKHTIATLVCAAAALIGLTAAASGLIEPRLEASANDPPAVNPIKGTGNPIQPPDVELHVVGANDNHLERVTVEVRPTDKPITLVLTSYMTVRWDVKAVAGARIKDVLVSGYFAQEIRGLSADIPVVNQSKFFADHKPQNTDWFYPGDWNTPTWREMIRKLNRKTGLSIATYQEASRDVTVVDGKRGREPSPQSFESRVAPRKEWTPKEPLASAANAELHIVGMYMPDTASPGKPAQPVDVRVEATAKPVVLVLTSYYQAVWNVKLARGARLQAVVVMSRDLQEVEGVPTDSPVYYCCPNGSEYYFSEGRARPADGLYAYRWNTWESRRLVERLNEMTGLLAASFQGAYSGTSFVVDGKRGSELAQKELKPRPAPRKEPEPKDFLAASADADLQVVSIYGPKRGGSDQVDVEVRPGDKPIVLALVSYYTVLWNVKLAKGAQVKAVVIGGYFEQEVEGIPPEIPLVHRTRFPGRRDDYFYGHSWKSQECQDLVTKLKELTGRPVATFQEVESAGSFVVDGTRGERRE
jgi:RNA polymerase sigma factor (sigma-70 family)